MLENYILDVYFYIKHDHWLVNKDNVIFILLFYKQIMYNRHNVLCLKYDKSMCVGVWAIRKKLSIINCDRKRVGFKIDKI